MYNLKTGLLREFSHEANSTKELFNALPESALEHRAQPQLWSLRDLASHIISIYSWYEGVFNSNSIDISQIEKPVGTHATIDELRSPLDTQIAKANLAIENWDEQTYLQPWKLVHGETVLIPESPKIGTIRGMLFSHLYHHRGEMVAHLRTLGHPVPGLYGPTYEQTVSK
ncbi:DinB family protein [Chryseobacterium sp. A301]